jgi:hypothetical protein
MSLQLMTGFWIIEATQIDLPLKGCAIAVLV